MRPCQINEKAEEMRVEFCSHLFIFLFSKFITIFEFYVGSSLLEVRAAHIHEFSGKLSHSKHSRDLLYMESISLDINIQGNISSKKSIYIYMNEFN